MTETSAEPKCPQCGSGERDIVGIVYPGVYDGVAEWECSKCGLSWQRFPDNKRLASALNAMRARWAEEALR